MLLLSCAVVLATASLASMGIQPAGWLDRMVQYHREKFLQEFDDIAPVKIKANVIPLPPGYSDSPSWDYPSVLRLLALIRASEEAAPARRALRRALRPSRRFMSRLDSYKHFPSLWKNRVDNTYYSSYEEVDPSVTKKDVIDDDPCIIVISNPVEARLPSARISIALLKQIMEARAAAGRVMPTTTKRTPPTSKKSGQDTTTSGGGGVSTDNSTPDGNGTDTKNGTNV